MCKYDLMIYQVFYFTRDVCSNSWLCDFFGETLAYLVEALSVKLSVEFYFWLLSSLLSFFFARQYFFSVTFPLRGKLTSQHDDSRAATSEEGL